MGYFPDVEINFEIIWGKVKSEEPCETVLQKECTGLLNFSIILNSLPTALSVMFLRFLYKCKSPEIGVMHFSMYFWQKRTLICELLLDSEGCAQ